MMEAARKTRALTWALYLLGHDPESAERIRREVAAAGVADGHLTAESLEQLPFRSYRSEPVRVPASAGASP